jgi:Flp pilus assembly pilin Flp
MLLSKTSIGQWLAALLLAFGPDDLRSEEGQTLVEYALILLGIVTVLLVAVAVIPGPVEAMFANVGSDLRARPNGSSVENRGWLSGSCPGSHPSLTEDLPRFHPARAGIT